MQKQLEEYVKTIAQLQEEAYSALEQMKETEKDVAQKEMDNVEVVSQLENEVVKEYEA